MAGNLFGLGAIKKVRLQDIVFSQSIIRAHKGPGIRKKDARKILGVCDRSLVDAISSPGRAWTWWVRRQWQKAAVRGGLEVYGIDCIVLVGGGLRGHPDGTRAGARAMMQATEGWLKHIALDEYALDHKELEVALKFWGC